MATPADLSYTKEHEWVRFNDDGTATVGITDFAQDQLGDIVYLDLPKVGTNATQNSGFGEIESVKSVSELFAPMSGEIVEVNSSLSDTPATVNSDPYGEGWIIKIKLSNPDEKSGLLSAADYEAIAQ